ncbi:MAG TPA: hypothetical protein VEQ60_04700 [Longimicrobium sp.]|nr:hypothetical protein [Longimicrobium sp.]
MKLPYIALAAVAAALLSTPAQAQPAIIASQLSNVDSIMESRGFVPADEAVLGTLAEGDDEEFELEFENGTDYVVWGVCDLECSDLDLVLTDASGNEVDADREMDDKPLLVRQDQPGGTFVLAVQMATCGSDECHYAVRVFRSR